MRRARAHKSVQTNDLLGFELAGVNHAIEIGAVREITLPLSLIPFPKGPPEVIGLADYRDQVLVVIDLRQSLGFDPSAKRESAKWIVAQCQGQLVALVVDLVTDVFSSEGQSPKPVPPSQQQRGIAHAYKREAELVFVVDLARLCEPLRMVEMGKLSTGSTGR